MVPPFKKVYVGEKIIKALHPSPWYYFSWYAGSVLLIVVDIAIYFLIQDVPLGVSPFFFIIFLFFVAVCVPIIGEITRRSITYYITNKRVAYQFSLIFKNYISCTFEKIENLETEQTLTQRIIKIGNLTILTAGYSAEPIIFSGIKNPDKIKELIEELIDRMPNAGEKKPNLEFPTLPSPQNF